MTRRAFLPLLLVPCLATAQDAEIAPAGDLASASVPSATGTASIPAFQAGILALKGERPQEAIPYLTRELAEHPQNGKAWYYRGVCHANTGDAAAALSDFDRALELMPGDANALLRRSELNTANKAYDAAIVDLEAVLRVHQAGPIAEHALMGIGEVHMRRGDHAAAIAVYDRFVAIAPSDARSWFNRGIAHAHNNEHQQAFDDLSKAIKLDGWMHKAYASRAIELIHLDRKPEACLDLAKAKELGDDSVDELRAIYCE
jgi:tetratricopeptide (TPR) repeat protein